jgi:hypothetical protein
MERWNWDRIAAAMGFAFVGLFVIAFVVAGELPKLGDSSEEVAAFYVDDRGRVITGLIVFGVAAVAFAWFVGAVATTLRNGGEVRLGATALGAGAATLSLAFVLLALGGAEVSGIAAADPDAARTINILTWAFQVTISWPVAAFVLAVGVGAMRTGVFPQWLSWASIVGAAALALGGTAWARDGFWAPDGAYGFITIVVFLVWMLAASWFFMQRVTAEAPRPTAAAV